MFASGSLRPLQYLQVKQEATRVELLLALQCVCQSVVKNTKILHAEMYLYESNDLAYFAGKLVKSFMALASAKQVVKGVN